VGRWSHCPVIAKSEKRVVVRTRLLSIVAWVVILSTAVSCSSTTLIRSSDSAANIYVNGVLKGKGMITHSDRKIVGSTTVVRIQKEGCEPMTYSFRRTEVFAVGPFIGGLFVLFPLLWMMKYRPDHFFAYQCVPQ
jgi:hypothetical protein